MSDPQGHGATARAVAAPEALLDALRADAGSLVDGAAPGSANGAPDVAALTEVRALAILSAWTGARLHAGLPGLLRADDPDLALLVGDWCFAQALQALAHDGDLAAIGRLATAIGDCAAALASAPADPARLPDIWRATCEDLCA